MNVQTKRVSFNELRQREEETEEEEEEEEPGRAESQTGTSDENEPVSSFTTQQFTKLNEAVLAGLVAFYVADIALDVWVAVRFFASRNPMNAWFVVFCILMPNLYAGYKSLQWYLRAHDQDPIRRPLPWMIRVAFFPVSLILRYYDTWQFGRGSRAAHAAHDRSRQARLWSAFLIESAEVALLRLFTLFLEDAPVAVINLKEVILTPPHVQKHKMEMVSVVMFKLVFTMTLGVVHFLTSTKAVYDAAKTEQYLLMGSQWGPKGRRGRRAEWSVLSLKGEIVIYMWHLCGIGSRLVAYAMFVSVYHKQLWILVGVRWILNTVWIKTDAPEISLTNCVAFGGVYLFSFVPTAPKPQLLRVVLYHVVNLVENVLIAVLFSHAMRGNPYSAGGYAFVFGGSFFSLVFMTLYYGLFHPKKEQLKLVTWFRERRGRRASGAA